MANLNLYRSSIIVAVWLVCLLHQGAQGYVAGEAAPEANEFPKLLFLGTYRSNRSGAEGRAYDIRDYYISLNPAAWSNAKRDCATVFKTKGGLVAIELEDEFEWLNEQLEEFGSGKLYWTGGQHSSRGWLWSATGEKVPDFVLASLDTKPPTSQDRIVLNYVDHHSADFTILQDSQPQRYICEVDRNTP